MRARVLGSLLIALVVLTGGTAGAASGEVIPNGPSLPSTSACVGGDPAAAGVELFGNGTELARTDVVGGLTTALVLEQFIAPGTRHRLIAVPGGWCDAERAFNHAWQANGRSFLDSGPMAEAYAQLAAAPYFDQTTVTSRSSVAGVHEIKTHSLTNGIEAKWTVVTDPLGVRSASWVSTDFAVKPFVAQWEGLTALEGLEERYLRAAGGLLDSARGLPTGEMSEPAAEISYTAPDGFKIMVSIGDSRNAVDVGTDTGNHRLDLLRIARSVIQENYEDFYDWGLRGDWTPHRHRVYVGIGGLNVNAAPTFGPPRTGYVQFNSQSGLACLACVWIADDFQIHLNSEFPTALAALGYTYPEGNDREVLATVLGHEMFHNWQNNYVKPTSTGRSVPGSYSEGTARFQETLHAYSHASHQPDSLVYAHDANGCNGVSPSDTTLAGGAFEAPSYSACNFWLPWYGAEGLATLSKLIIEGAPAGASAQGNAGKVIRAIEVATGESYANSAAEWAAGLITGKGMVWGPPDGSAPALDWGEHLARWKPAQLLDGESATQTLNNGGVMARRIHYDVTATITEGAVLAVLRDSPTGTALSYPAAGAEILGPGPDEKVYLIGINPSTASLETTIGIAATDVVPPPPEPVSTTMYMHGRNQFGEIDGAQWFATLGDPRSPMTLDGQAPTGAQPKSMTFANPALNDSCTGLPAAFPTFTGDMAGRIVGDMKMTLHFASAPGTIKARLWSDVGVFNCDGVEPASEVDIEIPPGQSTVEVTFEDLNLNATRWIVIEILALSGESYEGQVGRLLYDSTGTPSRIEFTCAPQFGETDCLP